MIYGGSWSQTVGHSRTFKVITLFSGKFVINRSIVLMSLRVHMVMCCFLFFLFYVTVLFYVSRISWYSVSATGGLFSQLFVSAFTKIVLTEVLVIVESTLASFFIHTSFCFSIPLLSID